MSTPRTTRHRPRARELAPFAILALMIAALALLPVLTEETVRTANVYDIFQNFASYGLVALALGITIIAGEFDLSVSSMYLLGGMVAVLTGAGSPLLGIARRARHRHPRRRRAGRPDRGVQAELDAGDARRLPDRPRDRRTSSGTGRA